MEIVEHKEDETPSKRYEKWIGDFLIIFHHSVYSAMQYFLLNKQMKTLGVPFSYFKPLAIAFLFPKD